MAAFVSYCSAADMEKCVVKVYKDCISADAVVNLPARIDSSEYGVYLTRWICCLHRLSSFGLMPDIYVA